MRDKCPEKQTGESGDRNHVGSFLFVSFCYYNEREGVLLGMFSRFFVLFLLVIFYVRLQHVEEKTDNIEAILRKKIFHDMNRKLKMRKKLGATRPNIVFVMRIESGAINTNKLLLKC